MSKFYELLTSKHHVSQIVFILIILYCVSSINVLILALAILPSLTPQGANFEFYALVGFAVISFVLAVLVSIYHLSTMLRTRKRKEDRLATA